MVNRGRIGYGALLVAVLLLGAALLASMWTGPALAQTPTPVDVPTDVVRSVAVSGHGEVRAAPDEARINIGVETQAATADAALEENTRRMQALVSVLRDAGVARRDIQTSNFSIFPVYDARPIPEEQAGPPEVTAYRVSNQVAVTVRSLDQIGSVLDAVVDAGANQIFGIEFRVSDPEALRAQARELAMQNARRKAEQLAQLGEASLGRVLTISEGGISEPPVIMAERAMMADVASAVPIEAGEATISADVQVVYALQ